MKPGREPVWNHQVPAVGETGAKSQKKKKPDLEEACTECGKVITKRAIAHLWHDRVVCTACVRKLHGEEELRHAKEREKWEVDHEPPTERQLRFAQELGIVVKVGMTKWDVSRLITAKLDEEHEREARHEREVEVRYVTIPAPRRRGMDGCAVGAAVVIGLLMLLIILATIANHR